MTHDEMWWGRVPTVPTEINAYDHHSGSRIQFTQTQHKHCIFTGKCDMGIKYFALECC